ncbi:hypothetical protein PtA15_7A429 [Puccinia triticina]|uniref:Uncharacterized protein n=1 Tax=Puccinia triticina TaxID=208348 RepID=A0ABY7CN99_9BASI|nr:uncharacterized protein PtA15_7A429 [Puccinia triticina]WAQ86701.1 hypothetical protein PtA15_7A429 [Puccinia triticina]
MSTSEEFTESNNSSPVAPPALPSTISKSSHEDFQTPPLIPVDEDLPLLDGRFLDNNLDNRAGGSWET